MGNETEKNQQNPGQQQNNPGNQYDPNKKNPSQSGEDVYNPQDPTRKKPGPGQRHDRSQGPRRVRGRRKAPRILTGIVGRSTEATANCRGFFFR